MSKSLNHRRVSLIAAVALLVAIPATAFPTTPQELFERAETLYRQLEVVDPSGQAPSWTRVAAAFTDVAARYPESPLASEALWRVSWIHGRRGRAGDELAARRQLDIYRELVQQYPVSPHAPEALLRLAVDAEAESGPRAASLYSRLLQSYPATPQATLARNRMAELVRVNAATANPGVAEAAPRRSADVGEMPIDPLPEDLAPATTRSGYGDATPNAAATDASVAGDLARLTAVRHYSDRSHTRVVLDLDRSVGFQTGEAQQPERLFLDLQGVEIPGSIEGAETRGLEQIIPVAGEAVSQVRIGLNQPGIVRVVVDLDASARYTLFTLDDEGAPFRIVIDVPTASVASRVNSARRPPAPEGESLSEQLGLGVHRIVIDPGHGGTDPGAIGRTGTTEKDLTLQLSQALAERLRGAGYDVVLTRDSDRSVSLQERTEFANSADADLFISIHINSARNRRLRGFETYYLDMAVDPSAAETAARENALSEAGSMGDLDEMLATIMKNDFQGASSELASSIQDSLVLHVAKGYQDVRDLGVKTAPFFVLVGAEMPAVLVEASFVSNEEEEAWLKSSAYRAQLAEAIEIGLRSYVDKRKITASSR